jgi:hypothetical protein
MKKYDGEDRRGQWAHVKGRIEGREEFQADSDREECRTECVGAKPRRLEFLLYFCVFSELCGFRRGFSIVRNKAVEVEQA